MPQYYNGRGFADTNYAIGLFVKRPGGSYSLVLNEDGSGLGSFRLLTGTSADGTMVSPVILKIPGVPSGHAMTFQIRVWAKEGGTFDNTSHAFKGSSGDLTVAQLGGETPSGTIPTPTLSGLGFTGFPIGQPTSDFPPKGPPPPPTNVLGTVSVTLKHGFNLIANPLNSGPSGNQIGALAKQIQGRTFPADGTRIFKFRNDLNRFVDAIADSGEWLPSEVAQEVISPGEGFFVFHPETTDAVLTFSGEKPLYQNLTNSLPRGFSIKSNQNPESGRADIHGLFGENGDRYFQWDPANQRYNDWIFDVSEWLGPGPTLPNVGVGEAFLILRAQSSGKWIQWLSSTAGL